MSLIASFMNLAGPDLIVILLIILVIAAWIGGLMGYLNGPTGANLFWPGAALVLGVVFFVRQVRA